MRLSFRPGGLSLFQEKGEFVITIEDQEVLRTPNEKTALKKFHAIRLEMEEKYPARKLTKQEVQEALKRLVGDMTLREVRNSTRKSKFDIGNKQGRFDNR